MIDVRGHLGQLASRKSPLDALERYVQALEVSHLLVANLDAAGAAVGGRDLDEPEANLAALSATRACPALRPLYWVRVGCVDHHLLALRGALESEPFAGVMFAPTLNGFDATVDVLGPCFEVLRKTGRPAFVWTARDARARPQKIAELARKYDDVPVVLCNAGADTHWNEAIDVVQRGVERDDCQLYVETSHVSIERLVDAVRTLDGRRILFGSDAVNAEPDHAAAVRARLAALKPQLRSGLLQRLIYENANALLHTPSPAAAEA